MTKARRLYTVWIDIGNDLEQACGQFDTFAKAEAEVRYLRANGDIARIAEADDIDDALAAQKLGDQP